MYAPATAGKCPPYWWPMVGRGWDRSGAVVRELWTWTHRAGVVFTGARLHDRAACMGCSLINLVKRGRMTFVRGKNKEKCCVVIVCHVSCRRFSRCWMEYLICWLLLFVESEVVSLLVCVTVS
jgi:hypothetical protein